MSFEPMFKPGDRVRYTGSANSFTEFNEVVPNGVYTVKALDTPDYIIIQCPNRRAHFNQEEFELVARPNPLGYLKDRLLTLQDASDTFDRGKKAFAAEMLEEVFGLALLTEHTFVEVLGVGA